MKKLFLSLSAAIGVFAAASCSQNELDPVKDADMATITFTLGIEGNAATKAISDGKSADKLVYAVYDVEGNLLPVFGSGKTQMTETIGDITETPYPVSITLAKSQTYKIVFWAQNSKCSAYNTADLEAVKVSYTQAESNDGDLNNDETRDAFYRMVELKVTGDQSVNVELKRPFAQINVGVIPEDWNAAVASGVEIVESAVVIENAANEINLLTGAVSGTETVVTYIENIIPDEILFVDADKDGKEEEYIWVSMSYILAADESKDPDDNGVLGTNCTTLESLDYTFVPENGNPIEFSEGLTSVPVQRNWRTNILGRMLTGNVNFTITIDPEYDGDYIFPDDRK